MCAELRQGLCEALERTGGRGGDIHGGTEALWLLLALSRSPRHECTAAILRGVHTAAFWQGRRTARVSAGKRNVQAARACSAKPGRDTGKQLKMRRRVITILSHRLIATGLGSPATVFAVQSARRMLRRRALAATARSQQRMRFDRSHSIMPRARKGIRRCFEVSAKQALRCSPDDDCVRRASASGGLARPARNAGLGPSFKPTVQLMQESRARGACGRRSGMLMVALQVARRSCQHARFRAPLLACQATQSASAPRAGATFLQQPP